MAKKHTEHIDVPQEMKDRIKAMARYTYEAIGPDLPPEMSREELIEAISDADYMLMHGHDKEAYEYWGLLLNSQGDEILAEEFPSERY